MQELIDKLGEMQSRVAKARKLLKAYDKDCKELRELLDKQYKPDAEGSEFAILYAVAFSPKQNERKIISMVKVAEFLKYDLFMKLVKISLKAIEDHTTKAQQEELLETARTGIRNLTFIKKVKS